jgi:hypothetical protein
MKNIDGIVFPEADYQFFTEYTEIFNKSLGQ